MSRLMLSVILVGLLAGCATNRYVVTEGTYSAWKGERMYLRKKTILVDTKTGATWGLAYDAENKAFTRDDYGWEKLPVRDHIAVEGEVADAPTEQNK